MNMMGVWLVQLYTHQMKRKVTKMRKRILKLTEEQEVSSVKTHSIRNK